MRCVVVRVTRVAFARLRLPGKGSSTKAWQAFNQQLLTRPRDGSATATKMPEMASEALVFTI